MKKSIVSECQVGSAEEVVLHAAWQKSRGRRPSMAFLGERNPRKALALANVVVRQVAFSARFDAVVAPVVARKSFAEMSDAEIKVAARQIIRTSSTEAEARRRLRDEIGYPYSVALSVSLPADATGREARELVRGLGGLVMANGAMAMCMMHGHDRVISL